jgi:hypothetical protein
VIERENEQKSVPRQWAKQGPSNRRRPVPLVALVGALLLVTALGSLGLGVGAVSASDLEGGNQTSAMRWAAQGTESDESLRSVALAGESQAGGAVAGPSSTSLGTLSASPTEAYARSLAQAGQGMELDEAFVQSVAFADESLAGGVVAGPSIAPLATLSMSPTEADADAWSLAQAGQAVAYQAAKAEVVADIDADTLRWVRLAEAYEAARAEAAATAMTNRFTALAAYYGVDTATLAADFDADTLRWFRLAEAYQAARAERAATAMTARYIALAEYCDGTPVTTQNLLCSADYGQLEP